MNEPWHKGRLAAFDTETTGVDVDNDRIVTATVWTHTPGHGTHHESWLLDPGVPIPDQAAAVHGITTERAQAAGSRPAEGVDAIADMLAQIVGRGTPIVIYNAAFDLSLLEAECRRYGVPTLHERVDGSGATPLVVDPLVLDRKLDPTRHGSRRLANVCGAYGVDLPESEAHTASGDCVASARLAYKLAAKFPDVGSTSPRELQQVQAEAFARQAEQIEARKVARGDMSPTPREWPVRSQPALFGVG